MTVARDAGAESAAKRRKAGSSVPARVAVPLVPVAPPKSGASACACGGSCPRCRDSAKVQPKLVVGAPDDAYEREADRIAAAIVSNARPAAATPKADKHAAQRAPAALAVDAKADEAASELEEGRPLDVATRKFFEPRLGHDLGGVRVHTGARARQSAERLGARAYTLGRDVVFGAGEYAPDTSSGRHLLAHELVHVVQQSGAAPRAHDRPAEPAAPSAPPTERASAPSMRPGAYSLNLITETSERFIGPPELKQAPVASPEAPGAAASAQSGAPEGASPAAAKKEPAPQGNAEKEKDEPTTPVQRMPKSRASGVWIQRTATFTAPKPTPASPLTRLAAGLTPGLTSPKINGTLTPDFKQLLADISPKQVKQTGTSGKNMTCAVDSFNIDTTADQIVASAAPTGGWVGAVPPSRLDNPTQCAKVATVPVTMNALPSNADFVKRVQQSEDEHAADLKTLHTRHFVPYDAFINGLTGSGADLNACGQDLVGKLNNRHMLAAFAFVDGWTASLRRLEDPNVGTHVDKALVKAATDCSSATVTLSQKNATIPGAGPGNVVTIKPTVTSFNPKTLKVNGNNLEDGATVVKTFTTAANATAALGVIQHYGMDSLNVIGAMEFFLVGGKAPSGALAGASEQAIDPSRYQVTVDRPTPGDWAVADAEAIAKGVNVNTIVNFGAKRDEAYSAWAVMTSFGFTWQGWVGGTRLTPEMMYFHT
jgi:hypothetical protein